MITRLRYEWRSGLFRWRRMKVFGLLIVRNKGIVSIYWMSKQFARFFLYISNTLFILQNRYVFSFYRWKTESSRNFHSKEFKPIYVCGVVDGYKHDVFFPFNKINTIINDIIVFTQNIWFFWSRWQV